jgi:NAD+ diphosphatase
MMPIPFSGNPLERASYRRSDTAWLETQALAGLFLPFWQNRPLVADNHAVFLPWRKEWQGLAQVFLGLDGSQAFFAVELGGEDDPHLAEGSFQDMRTSAFVLPGRDIAIAGQAKALLDWHRRHGFVPIAGLRPKCATAAIAAFVPNVAPNIFRAPIRW